MRLWFWTIMKDSSSWIQRHVSSRLYRYCWEQWWKAYEAARGDSQTRLKELEQPLKDVIGDTPLIRGESSPKAGLHLIGVYPPEDPVPTETLIKTFWDHGKPSVWRK